MLLDVAIRDHDVVGVWLPGGSVVLEAVASDSSGEAHVFCMECNSLCMDAAKIGIFEETCQISLWSFLNGDQSLGLESYLMIDVSGDLSHYSLEGSSWKKETCRSLISSDFTKSDSASFVSSLCFVFHSSWSWGRLLDCLSLWGFGGHFLWSSFGGNFRFWHLQVMSRF